ncbi:glycoside hydrolase family 25 protein [Pelomyxa schiedti]|nr:glycoside hydrolase family 25 protein [Pelomyxa schiedti]
MNCFFLVFLCLFAAVAHAATGVDVSQLYSSSSWSCVVGYGYIFAIPRCYQSTGNVDSNCASSVKNAWAGGMKNVDVYMFPCPTCSKSAADQVTELNNYLKSNNVTYGMVWFDIEGTQYWSSSYTTNQNFFTGLVSQAKAVGWSFGVYTNVNQWEPIMGSSYTGGSAYQLWWCYWDDTWDPCRTNFKAFNGWTSCAIKQYEGDTSFCSMSVDKNCY